MNNLNESSKDKLIESNAKIIEARMKEAEGDPVRFIDLFLYMFNPKVTPSNLPFQTFDFQQDLVYLIKEAIEQGNDLFIEKCREMGATYTVLAVFLWFWRYIPGSNFLLGSRKEDEVDNTKGEVGEVSNKESSLFGKLEYMLNHLPEFMYPKGFSMQKDLNYMSLLNPELGNVIAGESANPNFSRSSRYKAILMDEFAFWEHDTAAWGATADTTNCRIVLTTPGIKPCKAKRLRFGKDGESIKVISLPYNLDPRKTPEWLAREKNRRSAEDFAREIMINWELSIKGKVYPEIETAEYGQFPYNPSWPLYMSWDFGRDGTAIQWWQRNMINGKKRLVEAYCNSGHEIEFYYPIVGKDVDSKYMPDYGDEDLDLFKEVKIFKKAIHYGDPDVGKHSFVGGTTTRQALESVGVYVQTKPQANDFISRRDATKVMLQNGIEINQTKGTEYYMECMRNARYPQRDEGSQSTSPINEPIHDWTSHNRTSTEYFAVNYEEPPEPAYAVENEVNVDPY